MQAGFKADQVQVVGRFSDYTRVSDEADRKEHVFWVGLPDSIRRHAPELWDSVRPLYDEHLRRPIDMWEGCLEMASKDSDFDSIRDEPAFNELVN
jgi:hypothetical protein